VYQKVPSPILITRDRHVRKLDRLPQSHQEFDERYLQELLVEYPELLPIDKLRGDAGSLLCIGREVPVGHSGSVDNLYLSTGGYPVIVETKLWRNPQARREVLSQVLEYTKELVEKDFEWFESVWQEFSKKRDLEPERLIAKLDEIGEEELDEVAFVDRVNRALKGGDILSLIVGDGIETRLQQLVSHLCEDSAHLRYSLALIELACYSTGDEQYQQDLFVVPRIIHDVQPVERAYVRIELAQELEQKATIKSAVKETERGKGYTRINLSEDDFLKNLDEAVGVAVRERVEDFYGRLTTDLDLEPEFKAAALMLKMPHPSGEKNGVSLLAIERQGRIYNTSHMRRQLLRWGISEEVALPIVYDYWKALHRIDNRFLERGMSHMKSRQFLPVTELVPNLDQLEKEVRNVVARIRNMIGEDVTQQ
jgi:hypothetical protein